jgi:hypothetical protein
MTEDHRSVDAQMAQEILYSGGLEKRSARRPPACWARKRSAPATAA